MAVHLILHIDYPTVLGRQWRRISPKPLDTFIEPANSKVLTFTPTHAGSRAHFPEVDRQFIIYAD